MEHKWEREEVDAWLDVLFREHARYVAAIDAHSGTVHVGDAAALDIWTLAGDRPVFTSGVAPSGASDARIAGSSLRQV